MLILASSSKSRKKLLQNADVQFLQVASSFDESSIKKENIKDLTEELSSSKAHQTLYKISNNDLNVYSKFSTLEILGCDSMFEFEGKAFGKPSNKDEAYARWQKLSSNFGYLHTGHTLLFCELKNTTNEIILKEKVQEVISSKIIFEDLNNIEIKKYIQSNEPLYCAGGFAIEARGGKYIKKLEGCFTNVMGLSLPWLRRKLLNKDIYL